MANMNMYYQMAVNGRTATIDIYGDITSWPWLDSDVSAYSLSKQLGELDGVDEIRVNINSYGGEVAEGLAIYNTLANHPAKVVTCVDGFACSIASVIFMAGDERIMNSASLLMVHNAWTYASGNSGELRKAADDLDVITAASKAAYLARVGITEEELSALMDAETWISPADALEMGFSTLTCDPGEGDKPAQSARRSLQRMLLALQAEDVDDPDDDDQEEEPDDTGEEQPGDDGEEPDDEEEEPTEEKSMKAAFGRFFYAQTRKD